MTSKLTLTCSTFSFRILIRERVMQYIEAKAKGAAPKLAKIPPKRQEGSLTDVLSASLQAAKRGGKVA